MKNIPKAVIKAMPYDQRLRNYEAEKTELLQKMRGLPADQFSEKLRNLADKWRI